MFTELSANRAILKSACMRQIFNSDGSISDVRRSVLVFVEINGKRTGELMSADKFDSLPNLVATSSALPHGSVIEVWDGRLLNSRKKNADQGYYKLETVDPSTIVPTQEESLF